MKLCIEQFPFFPYDIFTLLLKGTVSRTELGLYVSVFIEDSVVNFEIIGLKDETQLLGPTHYLIRDNIRI